MSQHLALKDQAPDFSLQDEAGVMHTLVAEAGHPVVLVFYPGDMTPGCTMQLCALRDEWTNIKALGATVFGINHAGAESHSNFRSTQHLPFPLLIDVRNKVATKYQAVFNVFGLTLIRRTVVVIGPDGKIMMYRRGLPKVADILKAVQASLKTA